MKSVALIFVLLLAFMAFTFANASSYATTEAYSATTEAPSSITTESPTASEWKWGDLINFLRSSQSDGKKFYFFF